MKQDANLQLAGMSAKNRKRALVLYEEFTAADEAVEFALTLDREVGVPMERPLAHWWLEMVEVAAIRAMVGREVSNSPYVILALRGDAHLSPTKRAWLAKWLALPRSETVALIVLLDQQQSTPEGVAAICHWLEGVTAGCPVNTFVYGAEPAGDVSVDMAVPARDEEFYSDRFIGACDLLRQSALAA